MASMNNISSLLDWIKFTHNRCILNSTLPQCLETETDGTYGDEADTEACAWKNKTVSYLDIFMTGIYILIRVISVIFNIKLAVDYYHQGERHYCIWTVVCMVVPMCVTALIYAKMCYQDKKFNGGFKVATKTTLLVLVSSIFLRYWNTLIYSVKCKRAELQGNGDEQLEYYNSTTKEESDIALIRLFECFMETAPQKILLLSIILMQENQISATQILMVLLYLLSVPGTLFSYNRCIRAEQPNKNKLSYWYMAPHLCWHFCISISRIFCIAFVAALFPLWLIVSCILHAIILGFVTYIVERPEFSSTFAFHNFLFCIALGFVYIFIYIPVKEAPTRYKYVMYYVICSVENIICVVLFIYNPPNHLRESPSLFYAICILAVALYYVGIICMLIYYINYHPNVKTRRNKKTIA